MVSIFLNTHPHTVAIAPIHRKRVFSTDSFPFLQWEHYRAHQNILRQKSFSGISQQRIIAGTSGMYRWKARTSLRPTRYQPPGCP